MVPPMSQCFACPQEFLNIEFHCGLNVSSTLAQVLHACSLDGGVIW